MGRHGGSSWGDGEINGDTGRYGEIRGDPRRSGEITHLPTFEKDDFRSSELVEPTVIASAAPAGDGVHASEAELPAEATTGTPAATACGATVSIGRPLGEHEQARRVMHGWGEREVGGSRAAGKAGSMDGTSV